LSIYQPARRQFIKSNYY